MILVELLCSLRHVVCIWAGKLNTKQHAWEALQYCTLCGWISFKTHSMAWQRNGYLAFYLLHILYCAAWFKTGLSNTILLPRDVDTFFKPILCKNKEYQSIETEKTFPKIPRFWKLVEKYGFYATFFVEYWTKISEKFYIENRRAVCDPNMWRETCFPTGPRLSERRKCPVRVSTFVTLHLK